MNTKLRPLRLLAFLIVLAATVHWGYAQVVGPPNGVTGLTAINSLGSVAPMVVNDIPNSGSGSCSSGSGTTNGLMVVPYNVATANASQFLTCWQTAATTSTRVFGTVVSGGGTSGTPIVIRRGPTTTQLIDNQTTAGHHLQISSTTAGELHDTGSANAPSSGQDVGVVIVPNSGAGTAGTEYIEAGPKGIQPQWAKCLNTTSDVTCSTSTWTSFCTTAQAFTADPGQGNTLYQSFQNIIEISEASASLPSSIDFRVSVNSAALKDAHGVDTGSVPCTSGTCKTNVPMVGAVSNVSTPTACTNYPSACTMSIDCLSATNTFTMVHDANDANSVNTGSAIETEVEIIYD